MGKKRRPKRRPRAASKGGWARDNKVSALDALAVSGWLQGVPDHQAGWSSEHSQRRNKIRLVPLRPTAAEEARSPAATGARPGDAALGGGSNDSEIGGGGGGCGGGGRPKSVRRKSVVWREHTRRRSIHLASLLARQKKVLHIYYDEVADELRWGADQQGRNHEGHKHGVVATRNQFMRACKLVCGPFF